MIVYVKDKDFRIFRRDGNDEFGKRYLKFV